MTRHTHLLIGSAITIPLVFYNPVTIVGLIGAYIPDIDIKLHIKHRTITHSILMLVITTLIISKLNLLIAFSWGLNYLSHLLLDSLTVMGVPFLYPFSKKKYGLKLFKTGKYQEFIFQTLAIVFILFFIYRMLEL